MPAEKASQWSSGKLSLPPLLISIIQRCIHLVLLRDTAGKEAKLAKLLVDIESYLSTNLVGPCQSLLRSHACQAGLRAYADTTVERRKHPRVVENGAVEGCRCNTERSIDIRHPSQWLFASPRHGPITVSRPRCLASVEY